MAKTRRGFVTNSSSSSFVIIGKKVRLDQVNPADGKYVAVGKWLYDGRDVFDVCADMTPFLHEIAAENDMEFFLVDDMMYGSGGGRTTTSCSSSR